jgi:hypothetical protein
MTLQTRFDSFRRLKTFKRTRYVLRVFFETLIFEDEVVIELVHTHYWTKQDGSKVDLDINNLCMYVLDGVLPRATLEMRIPAQPARATVASILDNIFCNQFVVVKRNEKRVQKLGARDCTPKRAGNRV